ncbi:MAG: T9SS type A sorting domain-containing protein [Bacteroidia bacterium]|nr:T9SS type A sorting domain-containing protein [Bacteroidia bacterium]
MKKTYNLLITLLFCSPFIKAQTFNFSTSPTPSIITGGYTVQATVSSTLAGATSYSWTVATAAASCAATQTVQSTSLPSGTVCTFTFPCCTNYTLSCTGYNGSTIIGSPITKVAICSTGGTNSLMDLNISSIKLFPNPAHNFINIESDIENVFVEVFDILGHSISLPVEKVGARIQTINTSSLAPGIYYVTISNGRAFEVHKAIIN